MILKILLYFPTILLTNIGLLLPFNKEKYKPATENERQISQYMRNKVRLLDYKARKIITPN
jgi:hypothetical protein